MSNCLDRELIGLQARSELVKSMFRSVQCILFKRPLYRESLNLFKMSGRFRYVFYVSISTELSQTLLDRLPDALPHLVDFIYHPKFFKEHFLNFQFIGKFKSLHSFHVHHRLLSIDELRLIFENCKFINRVSFEKSNATIRMSRLFGRKVYKATWLSSDSVTFASATFSVDELLDYFETSKWVEKNKFLGEREEEEPTYLRLLRRPRPAQ